MISKRFEICSTSLMALVAAALLAACGTPSGPAPVSERTASPPRPEAPARSGKNLYIVKKGDTLYSIARETGRDPRDLAAWNYLDAPTTLRIGQALRIAPPDGGGDTPAGTPIAVAKPIAAPAEVEVKPLSTSPSALPSSTAQEAPRSAGDALLKREPKGGKQPYSDQALAQLQQKPAAPVRPAEAVITPARADAKAETKVEPKQESKADAKVDTKADTKPEAKIDNKADPKSDVKTDAKTDAKTDEGSAKSADNDSGIDWAWPGGGKLVGGFNDRGNKGVDIAGRSGDAVLAAAPGKVMYVGSGIRGYGNLLIIKHSSGYLSAYGHNRKILVKEGQSIARGQKVAEMGDNDADQAKLHFEIRRQGKPVDPLKYLPPR